jgi:antitoxin HicB
MAKQKQIKDINYYMGLPYSITLKQGIDDTENYWVARVMELPHCMTTGATAEEALRDIEDAKREWIASNLEDKLPVPEPRKFTGQYHLRIPPSLYEALATQAESENVSLNQYMIMALARSVARPEATSLGERRPRYRAGAVPRRKTKSATLTSEKS